MQRVVLIVLLVGVAGCAGAGGAGVPDAGDVGVAPGCYVCTLDGAGGSAGDSDIDTRSVDPRLDVAPGSHPDASAAEVAAPGCALSVIDIAIDDERWRTLHEDPNRHVEVPVVVVVAGRRFEGAALEIHGGYARTVPKKSYRVRLPEDATGADPRLDLFGDGAEPLRRVVLQAAWIDPTFLRNKLTFDLVRALGGLAPRVAFVELRFNGAYHGLYTAIERVDRIFLGKQGLPTECNLYKAENHNANWAAKENPLAGYARPLGADLPSDDLGALLDALSHTPATEEAFAREVAPRLSLEDHLVWTAVHVFALDQDTFTKNYYLHHAPSVSRGAPEDPFRIVSWDSDATFGISWEASRVDTTDRRWRGHDAFSPRLYGIEAYRRAYLERLRDALDDGPLALDAVLARTAESRALLAECAPADAAKWQRDFDFPAEMDYLDASIRTRHEVLRSVLDERLEP